MDQRWFGILVYGVVRLWNSVTMLLLWCGRAGGAVGIDCGRWRLLGKVVSEISDEVLRVNRSIVVWDLGRWRR